MELPVSQTFSWYRDFEATDKWSNATGKSSRYINNDTDYPIRFLKVGHNVQLRENVTLSKDTASWQAPTYDTLSLSGFSATCWYTARAMSNLQPAGKKTPIGMIEASWCDRS